MFSNLDIPVTVSVIAFVYAVILTEPEMILAPWYRLLKWIIFSPEPWLGWYPNERVSTCSTEPMFPVQYKIATIMLKLLIDCERCIAGQAALWWYLFRVNGRCLQYNFIEHLFLICLAIFATAILQKIYRECRK